MSTSTSKTSSIASSITSIAWITEEASSIISSTITWICERAYVLRRSSDNAIAKKGGCFVWVFGILCAIFRNFLYCGTLLPICLQTFSRYFQNVSMCRYRYFLSNVSMYRYNTVSIHFKSIWYRYFFNHFLGLISVFIAFLCDNFCRNSKVTIIMFKNNVKRFLKCEILSIMENFYFWFDKNLNFLEYFGQKGVK